MVLAFYVPLFAFLSIITNSYIIFLILRKTEQANIQMTWYLVITIFSMILWIICVLLQEAFFPYFPDENIDNVIGFSILASISNIGITVGLLFLSVFIKYLVEPVLNFKQTSYLISLVVLISGFYIILLLGAFREDKFLLSIIFNFINLMNLIFVVSVLIFTRNDVKILKNEITQLASSQLVKQIHYLSIGLHVSLVGMIPLLIIINFIAREAIAFSFVLITISVSFIAYAYQLDPRVVFVLPERTYQAIVVNNYGLLRFNKSFLGEKDETSAMLISGALTAISSLMSEYYDTTVYPRMIEFERRRILIKWAENYFLAVFSDRDTRLIRSAMDATVKEISKIYFPKSKEAMTAAQRQKFNDIFDKTFYFVYH